MNPFQDTYYNRLLNWRTLRDHAGSADLETALIAVDRWWQYAPLVNHHLHPQDMDQWPDPWTLLSENMYCPLTRALGIVYTLKMSRDINSEIVFASDCHGDENYLVICEYKVLNYWPDTVKYNKISDFTIIKRISIESIFQKIT